MLGLGHWELLIILVVVMIIFGAGKLPEIGAGLGKRFLEEKSTFKELNGIKAEEYLQKARTMFQEMDLQWDLDELDKITATRKAQLINQFNGRNIHTIWAQTSPLCNQNAYILHAKN
jgi:sec-independent protein translocase protein TatA